MFSFFSLYEMEHTFESYQKWFTPLKTLDTLVYLEEDSDGKMRIIKFYKQNQRVFINKIKKIQLFLTFLQQEKHIFVPQYLLEKIELKLHEQELRYCVPLTYISGVSQKKHLISSAALMGEKVAELHNAAQDFQRSIRIHHINTVLVSKIKNLILKNEQLNIKEKKNLRKKCLALQSTMSALGQDKTHYGLIHSDLHLENWVFEKEEANPIDFDYLAYGHFLTDIAIVLHDFGTNKPKLVENFLSHYQKKRALPHGFDAIMLDFKYITPLLYLNWFYAKDNELIRSNVKIKNTAMENLKILIE